MRVCRVMQIKVKMLYLLCESIKSGNLRGHRKTKMGDAMMALDRL